MMRTQLATAAAVAALGLVAAGCGADPTSEPTPGATPGGTGQVASCVTGQWRSTQVSGEAGGAGAGARLSGGGGVGLTIEPTGATTTDFTGMRPVDFTVRVAGAEIAGSFAYGGRVSATIRTKPGSGGDPTSTDPATPTATPDPTARPNPTGTVGPTTTTPPTSTGTPAAGSGAWEPVGQIDWSGLRLTVNLTSPVRAQPLDSAPIGDYATQVAEQTGNVVDVDPMLGPGRYRCADDTLVLAPDDDRGATWTLTRA